MAGVKLDYDPFNAWNWSETPIAPSITSQQPLPPPPPLPPSKPTSALAINSVKTPATIAMQTITSNRPFDSARSDVECAEANHVVAEMVRKTTTPSERRSEIVHTSRFLLEEYDDRAAMSRPQSTAATSAPNAYNFEHERRRQTQPMATKTTAKATISESRSSVVAATTPESDPFVVSRDRRLVLAQLSPVAGRSDRLAY